MKDRDRDALRRIVPNLKGSTGTYDFEPVANVAEQLQHALETNADLAALLDPLRRLMIEQVEGYEAGHRVLQS